MLLIEMLIYIYITYRFKIYIYNILSYIIYISADLLWYIRETDRPLPTLGIQVTKSVAQLLPDRWLLHRSM